MVVLVDYRPALRQRTGVGEYVHEMLAALSRRNNGHELHLFTSSFKDRLDPDVGADLRGVQAHDLRIPGRVLNWTWHRLEWPAVERLVPARPDVVHSAHPLLMPTTGAAQVVTIHDLDFLDHPERTSAEIRRDYGVLVHEHARRADAVLTSSRHSAAAIVERLGVPTERVAVCPPGPPRWTAGPRERARPSDGYILFVGTLSARKNIGTLLDAYERLVLRRSDTPPLRLAGARTPAASAWLARIAQPPFTGRAEYVGYVPDAGRRRLFEGASLVVMPSWHEGFGLPALEAMALGIPVVAARAGALPEVVGDAGILFDPSDADALADAIERLLNDSQLATACLAAGLARTAAWSWDQAAERVLGMYADAAARRAERDAHRR
ncbi:MAG TPA: glycosyltransferase family 1 protein [Vicinamibacterales bacterium]|nr:glycosyltransferase family 1 protein [Vicinamibacterales bacterium]